MSEEVTRRGFIGSAGAILALGAGTGLAAAEGGNDSAAKIRIVGVSTSFRKGMTTASAVKVCLEEAAKVSDRIETELIDLGGLRIPGQVAAGLPLFPGETDDFPALAPKLSDPMVGGIIIGTPVYFGNMSSLCKAFLERWIVFRKDFDLSGKVGGVLAVGGSRNGGQELTIQSVQTVLMAQEMLIIGEGRPTSHWGGTLWSKDSSIESDELGVSTAKNLGKRVAETAILLRK
jgi:multimeric flavodoxin WrbA